MKTENKEKDCNRNTLDTPISIPALNVDDIYDGYVFPSLLVRIKAFFIDFVIILIVFSLAAIVIDEVGNIPYWLRGGILIFMIYLYDPLLISLWGGTIGHKLLKLEVKQYKDPELNISFPVALFRLFTKSSLGSISFFTVTANKDKRAIHDLFSGSIVIFREDGD